MCKRLRRWSNIEPALWQRLLLIDLLDIVTERD